MKVVRSEVAGIDRYRVFFDTGIKTNDIFPRVYEIVSNLAYAAQYLEYLTRKIETEGHSVIYTHLIKTYLVTGMGIVESMIWYFLKSNNLHKTKDYVLVNTFCSNWAKVDNNQYRIDSVYYKKLASPKDVDMSLDYMIRRVEKKNLFGNQRHLYKNLNYLRRLRNKVHIHLIDRHLDTDFNNFSTKEFRLMRDALYELLLIENFEYPSSKFGSLFSFLFPRPNEK